MLHAVGKCIRVYELNTESLNRVTIYVHFNMAAFYHILHNFFFRICFYFFFVRMKKSEISNRNGVCVCVCRGGRVCVACIFIVIIVFKFWKERNAHRSTDGSRDAIFFCNSALFACSNHTGCTEV